MVKSDKTDYSVYGPYKYIGAAEKRLLKSAHTYMSNPVKYLYMSKLDLDSNGCWGYGLNTPL